MKTINVLLSVIIIVAAIIQYNEGKPPEWFAFFLGWGLLLWREITE